MPVQNDIQSELGALADYVVHNFKGVLPSEIGVYAVIDAVCDWVRNYVVAPWKADAIESQILDFAQNDLQIGSPEPMHDICACFKTKPVDAFQFIGYPIIENNVPAGRPSYRGRVHTLQSIAIPYEPTITGTVVEPIAHSRNIRPTTNNLTSFIYRAPGEANLTSTCVQSISRAGYVTSRADNLASLVDQTPGKD